ncbi:MgtC/SapB family protein [soil metagenome]
MEQSFINFLSLLAALAIGLLIGIERGWSDRKEKEGDRIAGIRTFSLIGLLGGTWAMLSGVLNIWIIAVAFLAISALIIVAYVMDVRKNKDIGSTTAFAMMLTFALSAWAVLGDELFALGVTVIVMALLGYKPVLHRWLRKMEEKEIFAGIKLLIISVVLLPLLPNEGYGPWEALNPYWIWWMVVLISGLSFVGYFAMKAAGNRLGTLLTAITGGMASSTAVTLSLAQFARNSIRKKVFMAGVVVAGSIMFIRVFIEVSVVNPSLLGTLWLPLAAMFAGLVISGAVLWRMDQNKQADSERDLNLKNPFQIGMALKFGALLGLILVLSEGMKEWFGEEGIYALSVISGLMDVDAITLSLSRMSLDELSAEAATLGIILASSTNTLVKGFIFAFFVGIKESLPLLGFLLASVLPGLIIAGFMI